MGAGMIRYRRATGVSLSIAAQGVPWLDKSCFEGNFVGTETDAVKRCPKRAPEKIALVQAPGKNSPRPRNAHRCARIAI